MDPFFFGEQWPLVRAVLVGLVVGFLCLVSAGLYLGFRSGPPLSWRRLAMVLTAVPVGAGLTSFTVTRLVAPGEPAVLAFDADRWRDASAVDGDFPSDRVRMARDLIRGRRLLGLPKAAVIEELGRPYNVVEGRSLGWFAGDGGGLFPEEIHLHVQFDAESRVVVTELWSDENLTLESTNPQVAAGED